MTVLKHGMSRPASRAPEYRSWESARSRCRNPRNPDYAYYGARGISVDPRWDSFVVFFADMGPRPAGTTLDRKDTNGNYEPGNCRWANDSVQGCNKRNNQRVCYHDKEFTIAELSRETGIPYQRLHERIVRRGWTVDRAVTEPVRRW